MAPGGESAAQTDSGSSRSARKGDSSIFSAAPRIRRSLFPRFPEPITPEHYRMTGKVRAIVMALMIAFNLSAVFRMDELAIDSAFYWRLETPNSVVIILDILLGLLIWRGRLATSTMRKLTFVCLVLEAASTLMTLWAFGSVGSQMVMYIFLMVLIYRTMFDFAIGLTALLVLVGGHWLIVISEINGWIPAQPINPGPPDFIYQMPARQLVGVISTTALMLFAFWATNWTVLRLRHRERAIRILREALAAGEGGEAGRHTGRTLKDTYLVGSLIGRGGMGEVYRGRHRRTRREVAIKMLHPHLLDDSMLLARFRREAEVTGALGSEHIVEILDIDAEDDQPYLVLELLEGESLEDRITREGPLPLPMVADVVTQIARGVEVAHRAGVIHRDLKPANVFLTPREDGDHVKILDFGVSKIRGDATALTQEVALLGTPDFMSPEQARGSTEEHAATTDVFALGGIAYSALTGTRPFVAPSVPALLRCICDEAPVPADQLRPDLPRGALAVLTIAMAKRLDQRYDSVTEMAEDLAAALAGEIDPALERRAAAVDAGAPSSRPSLTWTEQLAETVSDRSKDRERPGSGSDPDDPLGFASTEC